MAAPKFRNRSDVESFLVAFDNYVESHFHGFVSRRLRGIVDASYSTIDLPEHESGRFVASLCFACSLLINGLLWGVPCHHRACPSIAKRLDSGPSFRLSSDLTAPGTFYFAVCDVNGGLRVTPSRGIFFREAASRDGAYTTSQGEG